jgi:serralysin
VDSIYEIGGDFIIVFDGTEQNGSYIDLDALGGNENLLLNAQIFGTVPVISSVTLHYSVAGGGNKIAEIGIQDLDGDIYTIRADFYNITPFYTVNLNETDIKRYILSHTFTADNIDSLRVPGFVFNNSYTANGTGVNITLGDGNTGHFTGAGDGIVNGSAGDNHIMGYTGNDQLYGNAGNDRLFGGSGTNLLNGGAGFDTVDYSDTNGVIVDLTAGTASGFIVEQGAFTDTLVSMENVIGSNLADQIIGTSGDNRLNGNGGADIIHAGAGNDIINVSFNFLTIYLI